MLILCEIHLPGKGCVNLTRVESIVDKIDNAVIGNHNLNLNKWSRLYDMTRPSSL